MRTRLNCVGVRRRRTRPDRRDGQERQNGQDRRERQGAYPAHPPPILPRQRPSANRWASTSGNPASMIFVWVTSTGYFKRNRSTRRWLVSTIAYAARGSPSRGWPTDP